MAHISKICAFAAGGQTYSREGSQAEKQGGEGGTGLQLVGRGQCLHCCRQEACLTLQEAEEMIAGNATGNI